MPSLNEIGHDNMILERKTLKMTISLLCIHPLPKKALIKFQTSGWLKLPVQCSSVVSCLPTSDQKNLIQLLVNLLHNGWRLAFLGRGRKCIFDFGHHLNGLNQLPVADFWFLLLKENV